MLYISSGTPAEMLHASFVVNHNILVIPGNIIDYFSPSITNIRISGLITQDLILISIISVTPLLLATVIGLRRIKELKILLLYAVFFLYSTPFLLFFGQTRYRLPVDFIMIVFLVIWMQGVWRAISDKLSYRRANNEIKG